MHKLQKPLVTQLRSARRLLAPPHASDTAIHAGRQHVKRARALLRLLRPTLSEATYRETNAALRDLNRRYRAPRDAAVIVATLQSIAKRRPRLRAACAALQHQWQRSRRQRSPRLPGPLTVGATLLRLELSVQRWDAGKLSGSGLIASVRATYRKGRRSYLAAAQQGSGSTWHECRKQTKYLYYQLQLAGTLGIEGDQTGSRAHRLSDLLGEDHDLLLLRTRISRNAGHTDPALRPLLEYIDQRRMQLLLKAMKAGSRLYRRTPPEFAARLHRRKS